MKKYFSPYLEVIKFSCNDVLAQSGDNHFYDDNELPKVDFWG